LPYFFIQCHSVGVVSKKNSRKRSWYRLNCLPSFSKKNSTCWSISRLGNLLSSLSRCFLYLGAVNFISTIINIKPIMLSVEVVLRFSLTWCTCGNVLITILLLVVLIWSKFTILIIFVSHVKISVILK
ncbi:hypothetical protein L9F63_025729, partial [Diploptera punctata]